MDQDNTKDQDKRNWRERLGIGAQGNAPGGTSAPVANGAQASKELPKISNDFRKEPTPVSARPAASVKPAPRPPVVASAVRPAPMAPRANAKVISPAPVSPEKLAERLRSQRDASTKLAEQRVQVAKQRGENPAIVVPPKAPSALPGAPKPKFTFAEEGEAKASPPPSRPTIVPPPVQPVQVQPQPQLSPARPPLGGGANPAVPGFQPRPQPAPYQPQQPLGYPPAGQMPPGYPQGYGQPQQPVPPYRPIDPSTGYAPPPGYIPQQRGFGLPPQQGGYAPPPGPRLNVPPRPTPGLNANYQPQQDYGSAQGAAPGNYSASSRMNRPPLRGPVPAPSENDGYEEEFYDEPPQTRGSARPTSTDYQQAYREAEYGYEDEAPRSKAPWILAGLLLGALLLAGLGVLGYQKYVKPMITGQTTTQEVPAVAAPEAPAKVQAEQPAAVQPSAAASPTKKQIYDRIVGDQEVLGGDVSDPVETPAAIPEPTKTNQVAPDPAPAGTNGEDAVPLPIPPPPGGTGGQQGSLDPASEKQSAELILPAAGESQAAVVAQAPPSPVAAPPAPGEIAVATTNTRSLVSEPIASGTEDISDAVDPVPVIAKKKIETVEKKAAQPVKEKVVSPKLGSKPVVLVAPAKAPKPATPKQLDKATTASRSEDAGGGLFDDAPVDTPVPTPINPAPVKKKRTLADLFSKTPDDALEAPVNVASADQIPPPAPKAVEKKPVAPVSNEQVASGGGDFVVQLASFRTRAEANTEYGRLQAKHAATLGRFAPIISEATVGGSTRFRLSVGRMTSQAQANGVCSSLFAGGERDCIVKRR